MKRAYRTTWNGITSIVAAETVSKAKYRTQISACNAGFGPKWTAIRVVRAPEHDAWAAVDETSACWDEGSLPSERDAGTLTVSDPGVTTLDAPNKYARTIYPLSGEPVMIDVYRVLDAYKVTDQAVAHAIKKLLMPGERGSKSVIQDLEEAAFSIRQAVELLKQKGGM